MERRPLKSLVREVLEVSSCLVQENGDLLEVVMPQEVAGKLGLEEYELLYFSPQETGNMIKYSGSSLAQSSIVEVRDDLNYGVISYGSEILDKVSQLMEDKGYFYQGYLPRLHLRKEGLGEIISQKLSMVNCISRLRQVVERSISYLILNFRYSALSEGKKDGIIPVAVNELTLASAAGMIDALRKGYYSEKNPVKWKVVGRRSLEEVFRVACRIVEYEIRHDISDFEKGSNRRLDKDVARLAEYYGTLKEEVEGRIRKRGLAGDDQERELSKIRAIDAELRGKIQEQQDRYSIKVNVELLNAMRVTLPVRVITLNVRRKDKEKDLQLVWNPLLNDLELPTCEGCFRPLNVLCICDAGLHHLCPGCHECPSCHKMMCRACYPQACPKCGGKFQER